jgi:hypothetical protein
MSSSAEAPPTWERARALDATVPKDRQKDPDDSLRFYDCPPCFLFCVRKRGCNGGAYEAPLVAGFGGAGPLPRPLDGVSCWAGEALSTRETGRERCNIVRLFLGEALGERAPTCRWGSSCPSNGLTESNSDRRRYGTRRRNQTGARASRSGPLLAGPMTQDAVREESIDPVTRLLRRRRHLPAHTRRPRHQRLRWWRGLRAPCARCPRQDSNLRTRLRRPCLHEPSNLSSPAIFV